MPYCPECGSPVAEPEVQAAAEIAGAAEAAAEGQVGAAAELGSAEVQIAQINADKEISLARIAAKMNTEDNATGLETAETLADAVVAAEPEPEPAAEILDDPAPEPEPTEEPPPVAEPEPEAKKKRNPWWE